MATKTILKDVTIKNRRSALRLINALEKAEKISSKTNKNKTAVKHHTSCKNISDIATIRKMFGLK